MRFSFLCSAVTALCLGLLAGCGSDDSAAGGNSGEYVSSSWHDDTVAHFLVKPTGELSGYLLVMNGWVYEMTGSVSTSGVLTLSVKDPETQQPAPGTTTTGTCDGAGTCTGTLYAGGQPFQYVLVRATPQTTKYRGIYKAPMTNADAVPVANSWFGIDAHGRGYGFAFGQSITGEVEAASGNFTLTTVTPTPDAVTVSGNIGADATINNGTWHRSTSSGRLSGSKLPLN